MIETLHSATCVTCGKACVYRATTSSGLWYHTDGDRTHMPKPDSRYNADGTIRL